MCNDLGDTVGDCEVSGDGGLLWLWGWDLEEYGGASMVYGKSGRRKYNNSFILSTLSMLLKYSL